MSRDLRSLSVEPLCPVWPMDYGPSLWVSGLGIGCSRVLEVEELWQLASWDEGLVGILRGLCFVVAPMFRRDSTA